MKAYVITIRDNEYSVAAAKRCIESGVKFGLKIDHWDAFTPDVEDPKERMKKLRINPYGFLNSIYSREDRAMAAFLSHYSLWELSYKTNEEILILEHDAVIKAPIPNLLGHKGCVSLGKPSYGNYKIPRFLGLNELQSKPYFPGAHAYVVTPRAAKQLMAKARSGLEAEPTDIFLNKNRFPFLQEYYPWPVEVEETFSTIQKERGCLAKHGFKEGYTLI